MGFKDKQVKVALITGAGSGIGKATVQQFIASGTNVVAVDVVPAPLHAFVEEMRAQGGSVVGVVANVANEADVAQMIDTAYTTYGRLDILCNNAGIMDLMTPVADVSLELWNRVMGVNLTGPYLACQMAIPRMIAQGGGSIVNTASEAGLRGGAAGTAYTVSKHGVIGLTRSIAFHYGDKGIRCNAVCPGGVQTAIGIGGTTPHQEGLERVMTALHGLKAAGYTAMPEEIASVITFLASDAARNINGAILPVDHGWAAA
jgi:NAD(P)-dependent dehydrogenase (short-subunit alcohol dehydrogenase family)